ncbi:MlaA family lipoprotein [bacterium]|nr:MlaA family lipoprotein [bacterium]
MFLGNYFQNIQSTYKKFFFSGISFDSSEIKKNNIFFAIKGNKVDGNNFISSAISNGAKIVVTEKKINGLKNGILFIQSNNIRKLLAEISFKINNKIPNNIIAVTGTNGKSSIADFYYQILDLNNKKVASIGTLGIKSKKYKKDLSNTTIDPIQLSKILNKLKKQNINNVIMEASSHGLSQNRLDGLLFNTGIFTNLSQDHLDYHKNTKNYLKAKLYLFEKLIKTKGTIITIPNNILQGDVKTAIINTGRLAVNTTVGLLGTVDVANKMGFPKYEKEDYGQTLGKWGVGPGCYIVLPVLGPSTVRDTAGSFANILGGDPWYNASVHGNNEFLSEGAYITSKALNGIDFRSDNLESLDNLEKNSIDFYASLRSLYLQDRENKIKNNQRGTVEVIYKDEEDWEEIDSK